MHHIYPMAKGDPLCPLGFHPQVRWPTRCKRCFRDYKEHGGRRREEGNLRRDETASSSPSLSWNSRDSDAGKRRSWVSSSNLANVKDEDSGGKRTSSESSDSDQSTPSSWTSRPDLVNLEDDTQPIATFSVKLPKRKQKPIDTGQRSVSDSFSITKSNPSTVFNKNDSLLTRAKKLQSIKDKTEKSSKGKRIQVKEVKTISEEPTNHDVQFLIQVKTKKPIIEEYNEPDREDDNVSLAGTETTDTTLVDANDSELRDQIESMKKELEVTKTKCDRLEREKSDFLLRRLAAMETTTSKTTASEVLKLQQKCNEMQQLLEDYKDEKRSLSLKVKELESDLQARPTPQAAQKIADDLKNKLVAAETLCEELMDENEDIKKEMRDMEEQMDEMQDNFREDQAIEYTSLKRELDQTTKNCRILSFKLRKAERKSEQLEQEKSETEKKLKEISGGQTTLNNIDKIKHLEQELKVSNEVSLRLQKELDDANQKINKMEETSKTSNTSTKSKAPKLSSLGKASSTEGKVSRESLTRGGSQDDPAQLLRDLQDSLEREADLREQLKFAEEEAQNLRKKASRVEDDNESLVLQLKKMANRARTRKLSPTNIKLTPESNNEKTQCTEEEDAVELKLQLELSEQEAAVLRRKVEEIEVENDRLKVKTKDLQEKVSAKTSNRRTTMQDDKNTPLQNQKLKVLEDETNDLRKKLIEKERDCERLHAELSLNQKRPKGIQKSKSLDLDQQALDLKRQLQVIEQEAFVLRSKVQSLESENEKLVSDNKRLQLLRGTKNIKTDKNIDKYIDQIATLEVQLDESNKKIKDLQEASKNSIGNIVNYKEHNKRFFERTPKRITNLTSKDQLKAMVADLESEIGDMIVAIKSSENEKIKLEEDMRKSRTNQNANMAIKELDETKNKLEVLDKELSIQKTKYEELNKTLLKTKDSLTKSNEEKKKLKEQIEKHKESQTKLEQDKRKTDDELNKLQTELKNSMYLHDNLTVLKQKCETLKLNLETKEKEYKDLAKELEAKKKVIDELQEKNTKYLDLEKKIKEAEEKLKKTDKQKNVEIKNLEDKIEQERNINKSRESERSTLTNKWDEERKNLYSQIEDLNSKIKKLTTTIETKDKEIQELENKLKKEHESVSKKLKLNETESKELVKLKEELRKANFNLSDTNERLKITQNDNKLLEDRLRKSESDIQTSKISYEKKTSQLELDLLNEKRKLDLLKNSQERELKNHETELSALKNKIRTLELNSDNNGGKKVSEIKQFQDSIEKLENKLSSERRKYDDLTVKYELLEEEHVVTKAKLVMEKETLDGQYASLKTEKMKLDTELKSLRETYNSKQDAWTKEKLNMEQQMKESSTISHNGFDMEKSRLKASVVEKQSELEQLRKEYDAINDQMNYMRRETDELRKKLDDYEKVNKVQRNISADSSAMEKEIRHLRSKLVTLEKAKKSDFAEYKMRYDSQLSIVNGELHSLQTQVTRFKRERDTYKHMLEAAQKTIGDLKTSPKGIVRNASQSSVHYDELEESRNKVATLEQQISCMEDELSEARLECSKLKTELVSDRSTWEVKMSELHSRVNELEEEKILSSGRTKIVGLRTRMELAWQKEREEQQRLLQETATLARDLRQTLFEVERERDKERLEAKRKQDQFKKSTEEDQDENKRKITELQCDLLELRDAHAKLRTTNEKLRREKEKQEKEREQMKLIINGKKRNDQQEDKKVGALVEQIDILKQLAPELFFSSEKEAKYTPTPPRRSKSKSRESSPNLDVRETSLTPEDKQQKIQSVMQVLIATTEDLRKMQKLSEDEYERERLRRSMGMRRAASIEHENVTENTRYIRKYDQRSLSGNLQRRSLSLEHTIQNEQSIWKNDSDSMSSMQSLDASSDVERWAKRDTSMDSRLSGGSTQSDIVGEGKKKKKGIIGKLKKLTKSRSIDDQDPNTFSPTRSLSSSKPNSNSDVNEDARGSKKDLKERITGMFKKSGSSSRSNSLERQRHDTSSTQRPLMRNGSNSNVARHESRKS